MISSINDIYRKEIYDKQTKKTIFNYISNLNKKTRKYVLELMLSDWYKCNYIMDNKDSLKILDNGIDIFIELLENNKKFLLFIYKNSKDFYSSSLIYKIMVMETIEEDSKDKTLYDINEFHVLDKISYSFSYDYNDINKYYLDYLKNNQTNKEFANEYITNKIRDLFIIDKNKYTESVIKFMSEYYKWNFYKRCYLNRDTYIKNQKEYLDIIKMYPIFELINLSIDNYEFLKSIIKDCLYNENFNNEKEKNEAREFLLRNTSEEFKKKLKIIKD